MTAATDPPATRARPPRVTAACALMESDWSSWHMVLYGLTWADYEALLTARFEAGRKRMRITYHRGAAEMMVPGVDPAEEAEPRGGGLRLIGLRHEVTRKRIAHLIEGWLCETGGHFVAAGHTIVSRPDRDLGFDADEVYFVRDWQRVVHRLDPDFTPDPVPDLVLEVAPHARAIDRDAVLAGLDIPEVWRYDAGRLTARLLRADGRYHESDTSLAIPGFPLAEVQRFVTDEPEDYGAFNREYRAWVRSHPSV
jgi:Uma2 family endonuclease